MPKTLFIDPKVMRTPSTITFKDIPSLAYQKKVKDVTAIFPKQDLVNLFRDMTYIREFETMLLNIKTKGEFKGVKYEHAGAAHLGIGQEASYVGEAYMLDVNDFIMGSHRSHGEVIAKGLRAIEISSDEYLMKTMEEFFDGAILKAVQKDQTSVKQLARDFLFYGFACEIFGRENGFNKGLGGSMHAFFTPFGIYPNNALVGGGATLATGAALFKKLNEKPGIVVCNIGDGSLGCGPVWEAFMFSVMDQMKVLWEGKYKGGMPIIYNIWENGYAMGGQVRGETMAYDIPVRLAAGITPDQMHAERVDGYNALAVIDAYKRKKKLILEDKDGPVFLDVLTYRTIGHAPSDFASYRTQEEIDAWAAQDPIPEFKRQLVEAGIATEAECDAIDAKVQDEILEACRLSTDFTVSPRLDLKKDPMAIGRLLLSNGHVENLDPSRTPETLMKKEDIQRVQAIKTKERFGIKDGKKVSVNKVFQLRDGLFEAILDKFYTDPTFVAYGEENRDWGGAFAVYRGLSESMPYHRMFNSPISESAIVGGATGYAMSGGRALVEVMYCDFIGRCTDDIFNQMAKWQAMSAGVIKMPVTLRVPVGVKYGAQHSQDWTAVCAHIPGLKVVYPVTPYDAKGLMTAALNSTDPVIFFESQRIYDVGELFHEGGVPESSYEIPFGEPDIKKKGSDITILTIGPVLYRALDAVTELEEKYGLSVELIDARSLVPFNYEPVIESVKKTGRIVLVGDGCERNSFMRNMASVISELTFDYLDAPPTIVGTRNWITPAHEMEDVVFPQASWIVDTIHERVLPLPGHVSENNFTELEQLRLNKLGI
jgi:2-oxoisovalerate dehydrogenase E1 component